MKHELEMAYIVKDVGIMVTLLEERGYHLVSNEHQENVYMYHPFFPTMIDDMKYLRFRYCTGRDNETWGEISFSNPRGEMIDGRPTEIRKSFGKEYKNGHQEIDDKKVFLKDLGWMEGIVMMKDRDYFSKDGVLDEMMLHFELDHDIIIKNLKDHLPDVKLEPTLQICIESNSKDLMDKKMLLSVLGDAADNLNISARDLVFTNYFGRYLEKIGKSANV